MRRALTDLREIATVVEAVAAPLNVLALPTAPSTAELATVRVRRVSSGSLLAAAAYGADYRCARAIDRSNVALRRGRREPR